VAELGIVDRVVESNAEAVKDADLVILCIPVGACGPVAQEIADYLKPGAIVSDVGSVKGAVVREMTPYLPEGVHFVPAHPVAGTEHSGPDSGFAELFINRWCILTPPEGTDPKAVERLRAFWAALGARVEIMTPDHHDLVLAITSHLPHLIAYTIVGTADELEGVTQSEVLKFSAGGFRDFTRIAASDPTMWRDVFLTNKDAPFAVATARRCSSTSPAPAPSAAASSRSGRIRLRPISAGHTRNWARSRSRRPMTGLREAMHDAAPE
jgi:cyclohexadieny/prephenate dehydrogenase